MLLFILIRYKPFFRFRNLFLNQFKRSLERVRLREVLFTGLANKVPIALDNAPLIVADDEEWIRLLVVLYIESLIFVICKVELLYTIRAGSPRVFLDWGYFQDWNFLDVIRPQMNVRRIVPEAFYIERRGRIGHDIAVFADKILELVRVKRHSDHTSLFHSSIFNLVLIQVSDLWLIDVLIFHF